MIGKRLQLVASLLSTVLLASCGGGSSSGEQTSSGLLLGASVSSGSAAPDNTSTPLSSNATPVRKAMGATAAASAALTPQAAAQFLNQATFGATAASISEVSSSGKAAWITAQFSKSQVRHRDYIQSISGATPLQFNESFFKQAVTGSDQLRQRMAYALSQIFVISFIGTGMYDRPEGAADYYDMLGRYAFGNFRDLLQAVALHPMMGLYLSHLHNQKESGPRVPDENFAREIMQLMSIGLYQLEQDGSIRTHNGGIPRETYTHDDVAGLAKVFTGWSWGGPDKSKQRFHGTDADPARDWLPMQMYPDFHSTSSKTFLGVSTNGSGEADLKVALDTLFNHPNVGPFIGRQLIQRLVTSNPSAAYISRVSAAFANNGAGVRGDMRAVIMAILTDPEASDNGRPKKLREPVLRMTNWMRAFNAKSASGNFLLNTMDDPLTNIGQTPLRSPSVFNFYRPTYTPPNTSLSAAKMVAPEMQITGEPSVSGYLTYMQTTVAYGAGRNYDIQPNYVTEVSLAPKPADLLDRVSLLLMGGGMSTTLRNQILTALNAISVPESNGSNALTIDNARKNRVYMAVLLTMASPEYLAQR